MYNYAAHHSMLGLFHLYDYRRHVSFDFCLFNMLIPASDLSGRGRVTDHRLQRLLVYCCVAKYMFAIDKKTTIENRYCLK